MSKLTPRENIMYALADEMAMLLRQEDDWVATASWLSDRALHDGFDLQMSYDSPEIWAFDLIENLGFHVDFESRWPNGLIEGMGCTAGDFFWQMIPYRSRCD